MYRIKTIQLKNFRSFMGKPSKIELGNKGQNLFIYGENGSGKTSICKALYFFLEAADKRRKLKITDAENIFLSEKEKGSTEMRVAFKKVNSNHKKDWPETKFTLDKQGFSPSGVELEPLLQARRYRAHLDYRALLKTYMLDTQELNLFWILVYGIFYNKRNPETNRLLGLEFDELKRGRRNRTQEYSKKLKDWSIGFTQIIAEINPLINELLQYFDKELSVELSFKHLYLTKTENLGHQTVKINVHYKDKLIRNHHDFFNEARLTALGISIFLAGFLYHRNPEEFKESYKPLILDDVFIGMDISNRLPLLQILKDKFSDWQIFITTYDRPWYEAATHYLGTSDWKFMEMYIGEEEGQDYTFSQLIDGAGSPLDKAEHYFRMKDYPACGNYLRKTLERRIKDILPENKLTAYNDDGEKRSLKLGTLFTRLLEYLEVCGLEQPLFKDLKIYTKLLLNPLSHDNAGSPIYRRELLSVFEIVRKLDAVKSELLISVNGELVSPTLRLSVKDSVDIYHVYKVQVLDNLKKITCDDSVGYSSCRGQIIGHKKGRDNWTVVEDGIPDSLETIYSKKCEEHGVEADDWLQAYRNNNNITINELKPKI
jgi:energy-coupling factor transporter ATP-binding protein EcfA2